MNLDKIKEKLEKLEKKTQNKPKVDYDKVFWRPTLGEHRIRIVPSAFTPEDPFTELYFHYDIGKYPMIALSNFGKQDPVEEFIKELKSSTDSDNWSLAGKLQPGKRTFAPVIVRGEEDQGVRIWGFSKTVYRDLLALANDEDVGDYTDPVTGFDLVVEVVKSEPYNKTSVRIKPKQSPLSKNKKEVELWLSEQPNPKEIYTEYDYDFIKRQLLQYLELPSEEEESIEESEAPEDKVVKEEQKPTTSGKFKLDDKKKSSIDDMFDELFK